jgi:D-glycero-D-manno-heptose 1,7-bisphosphate phosphatase
MKKALFIDRDGVINVDKVHVYRIDQIEFTDGIFDLCRKYYESGYLIVIITNQAGIAKGLYTGNDFGILMSWVVKEFENHGIKIEKVYHCPHHPEYTGPCSCRKPEPGMILKAIKELDLQIEECVLIGDKESDIEAGRRSGIPESSMLLINGAPHNYLEKLPGHF